VNSDGTSYTSKYLFTFRSQVVAFTSLIEEMAAYPKVYLSDHGHLTINTVDFHGLALIYRSKLRDLWHNIMCVRPTWLYAIK